MRFTRWTYKIHYRGTKSIKQIDGFGLRGRRFSSHLLWIYYRPTDPTTVIILPLCCINELFQQNVEKNPFSIDFNSYTNRSCSVSFFFVVVHVNKHVLKHCTAVAVVFQTKWNVWNTGLSVTQLQYRKLLFPFRNVLLVKWYSFHTKCYNIIVSLCSVRFFFSPFWGSAHSPHYLAIVNTFYFIA